jgi:hypothetical protein
VAAYVQALSAALYLMGARVAERDRMLVSSNQVIQDLQSELDGKVSRANAVIDELQTELHEKVGETNRVIAELQVEHRARIGDRDRSIRELQAELHDKVGEANAVIQRLQVELHDKVGEANNVIRERDRLISTLAVELERFRRREIGRRKRRPPRRILATAPEKVDHVRPTSKLARSRHLAIRRVVSGYRAFRHRFGVFFSARV